MTKQQNKWWESLTPHKDIKPKDMNYPTIEQVNAADHTQLCKWWRFLKSPGVDVIGKPEFEETLETEVAVINRINERITEFGGFTLKISKNIGW